MHVAQLTTFNVHNCFIDVRYATSVLMPNNIGLLLDEKNLRQMLTFEICSATLPGPSVSFSAHFFTSNDERSYASCLTAGCASRICVVFLRCNCGGIRHYTFFVLCHMQTHASMTKTDREEVQ